MLKHQILAPLCFGLLLTCITHCVDAARVNLVPVPDGGIQPRAVVDGNGGVHLVFLKGPERESDVYYVKRAGGSREFGRPIRVNSQRGSAVAMGTIRGPQIALGSNARVHVVWNGGPNAQPRTGAHSGPMLYSRLDDGGGGFEPQRNLMTKTVGLDGGGTVTADGKGNVYVMWHGAEAGVTKGEGARAVYLAGSQDGGKTFAAERRINPKPTGACGCCGMDAFGDSHGNIWALYRTAEMGLNRNMTLLVSRDAGRTFADQVVSRLRSGKCPMSSSSFRDLDGKVLAAWETEGSVQFGVFGNSGAAIGAFQNPAKGVKGKHPVAVGNRNGETLLVWVEGSGWKRAGTLAWQIFNKSGTPAGPVRRGSRLPVWSRADVIVEPNGDFTILH